MICLFRVILFPQKRAIQRIRELQAQRRKNNFVNIILKQLLIEFYRTLSSSDDKRDSLGVQWFVGVAGPSILCEYPDQDYWETHSIIFMFINLRWCLTVRGKKMPYRNYDQYLIWNQQRNLRIF